MGAPAGAGTARRAHRRRTARWSPAVPSPPSLDLRLAYVLDGNVYLADWDGADPVQIVDGNPAAPCPEMVGRSGLVAPDGLHIAYRANWGDGCPNSVNITDLDGHLVTSLPAGVGWDIGWSPGGTRRDMAPSRRRIGIYGIDGERQAVLHLPDGYCVCGDRDPMWSPDGNSLLLSMTRADASADVVVELPIDGGRRAGSRRRPALQSADRIFARRGSRGLRRLHGGNGAGQALPRRFNGTQREVLVSSVPGNILTGTPVWSAGGDRTAVVINHDVGRQLAGELTS